MNGQSSPRLPRWLPPILFLFFIAFVGGGAFVYLNHQELVSLKKDMAAKVDTATLEQELTSLKEEIAAKVDTETLEKELANRHESIILEVTAAREGALEKRDQKIATLSDRESQNRTTLEGLSSVPHDLEGLEQELKEFRRQTESTSIDIPALFEKTRCSVAELHHEALPKNQPLGTPFLLDERGMYLSVPWHALNGRPLDVLSVRFCDGKTSAISKIVAMDILQDTAIIQIANPRPDLKPLPLAKKIVVGQPAFAIGHPGNAEYKTAYDYSILTGHINGLDREGKKHGLACATCSGVIQFHGPVIGGLSGAPLINNQGEVLGHLISTDGYRIGFAVSFEKIKKLLDSLGG